MHRVLFLIQNQQLKMKMNVKNSPIQKMRVLLVPFVPETQDPMLASLCKLMCTGQVKKTDLSHLSRNPIIPKHLSMGHVGQTPKRDLSHASKRSNPYLIRHVALLDKWDKQDTIKIENQFLAHQD